jgi:uncharacterized protein
LDYLIPGMLGFFVGALLFAASYAAVMPPLTALINLGATILPTVFDVNLWLSIGFFVLFALTLFYFLERHGELRKDKTQ